jgi:hypothetical protein
VLFDMALAAAVLFSGSFTAHPKLTAHTPPDGSGFKRQDRPNLDRAAPEESRGGPINYQTRTGATSVPTNRSGWPVQLELSSTQRVMRYSCLPRCFLKLSGGSDACHGQTYQQKGAATFQRGVVIGGSSETYRRHRPLVKKGKPLMRTTTLVPAVAFAAIGFAPFTVLAAPTAHAIPSCAEQLQELAARLGKTVDPAIMAQCQAAMANPQYQQQHQQPTQQQPTQQQPQQGPLPCTPAAPGVNGNCGFTYAECGLGALTGVGPCPAGLPPGAPPPAAPGAPPPAAPGAPPPAAPPAPVEVPQAPLPNTGPPMHAPPECANLDYFIQYRIMCEQNGAPYPPGYTPGMNDTPPA